jgi:hypothetical protein
MDRLNAPDAREGDPLTEVLGSSHLLPYGEPDRDLRDEVAGLGGGPRFGSG